MARGGRHPFWEGFFLGLESGASSGYNAGYDAAEADERTYFEDHFGPAPRGQLARDLDVARAREQARTRPFDTRTPAQLKHDAYLSWGLEPPPDVADAYVSEATDPAGAADVRAAEADDAFDTGW